MVVLDTSQMLPWKISAKSMSSFLSEGLHRHLMSISSLVMNGRSDRSVTLCTCISLSSCLMTLALLSLLPGMTVVMRDKSAVSELPTARLWMLYPRRAKTPVTFTSVFKTVRQKQDFHNHGQTDAADMSAQAGRHNTCYLSVDFKRQVSNHTGAPHLLQHN